MEIVDKPTLFDRSLVELVKPNWEKAIYFGIFLVAVVSRFWDLGARAMSHDESLHALYSYYLYNGTGYQHNPMMHGPFLFHANALIYFLFGDSDYTARIMPALFGVFLVMSPLLLRRWLGRLGAIVASVMLLISPSILYYSRYIRNDVYIAVWTILLIAALFQFMRSRKASWFLLGAAVLMLSLATKENAYIFGFIGLAFVVEMILWERVSRQNQLWLYVGGAILSVILLAIGYVLSRPPAEGAQAAAEASNSMKLIAAMFTVVGGSIPVTLLSASLIRSRHPQRSRIEEAIRSVSWRVWGIAAIAVFLIYALLFSTFFTNPSGLLTGVFGSISYWLAQQEVQRGGQPWYYYILVLTMYEFVPFLCSMIAVVYYLVRGVPDQPEPGEAASEEKEFEELLLAETEAGAVPRRWRGTTAVGRQATRPAIRPASDGQRLFVAFLIFWTISSFFIYSWAGEKMPWLVVHPLLPLIILTAKFAGDLFSQVNWREVWPRGGALLALLLPVTLFGLYTLLTKQPLQGLSLSKLQETGQWFAALLVTLLLLVLTSLIARRLGGKRALQVGVGTLLIGLSFFTVRFAWMASYINYDYATELLVYAHGAADVKPTMAEIAEISARTVGDKQIKVAYDNEVSWPLEWYMRQYPNRVYYGDKPTREALDVPVVLVSERNDAKVQPFLGDRYYKFKRRLVWWPNQQYMGLTWERIRNILTSPEKRQILWNILYWRKYPRSTDDWYHVHNFYMYVRKDVAQQIWDFGAMPPQAVDLTPNPYVEKHIDLSTERVWGDVGTEPGQFNHPRGIAVGPDGNVYVVDSDNYRVQVFDPNGTFLRQWGSQCNLEDSHGCVDPDGRGPLDVGDGQFQEPWGIAVAPDGRVYVADTWNHRIQAFDSQGNFLTKWGVYGQTNTEMPLFYGPRDVAVDASGRVFVTDTGNKRVLAFDQDGNLLYQWGGSGVLGGYFEEPVGLDVGADGNLYVADTWNQRIQVFDGDYVFLRDWPVDAWYGQSVVNKPYLAVDAQNRVYITDPEGYLVVVYDSTGNLLATFGTYGYDQNSFSLPTGIAVDNAGYIYVTDTDGQRVMKFQPLS
jgi:uncharacterized protein (TIGR03663 family)